MNSCNSLSLFDSDIGSLSLDVNLEVKSESEDDERSNDDSFSDQGSLVEGVQESNSASSTEDGDSDSIDDELEVEIDDVMVQQENVGDPPPNTAQPELSQAPVLESCQVPVNTLSVEKPITLTKALREVKRPPRGRRNLTEDEQEMLAEQNPINPSFPVHEPLETDSESRSSVSDRLNGEEEPFEKVEFKKGKSVHLCRKGKRRECLEGRDSAVNEVAELSEDWNSSQSFGDGDTNNKNLGPHLKVGGRKKGQKKEDLNDESKPEYFECADCGRKFREKSHLATHSRAHIDIRNFKCNQCGCLFKTKTNLYFHSMTHSEVPFTCEQCNKTYPERKMLKRHIRVVHSSERFGCDQCGRCFKSSANLALHYTLHTGAKPYSCEACDKGFVYKSTYTAHMKAHDADSRFTCDQCPTRKDCHHHSEARPWLCTVCGKAYPLKGTLKNHMKIHEPEKPYKCGQCPKSFMKKQSYECHMKQHRGERPEYMCDQCSQSYFNVFALKRHYMKHTGERGFSCQVCRKAFWMKDALRVHMRTHSSVKMFPCDQCPKAFSHKHTLDAHARTHSAGAQPYSCSTCGKGFVHKYNLARHERQHIIQPPVLASPLPLQPQPPLHSETHTLHVL